MSDKQSKILVINASFKKIKNQPILNSLSLPSVNGVIWIILTSGILRDCHKNNK